MKFKDRLFNFIPYFILYDYLKYRKEEKYNYEIFKIRYLNNS